MSQPLPLAIALGRVRLPARFALLALALAVLALIVRLWPQWLHNPDLSHGLFMPLVFLWLLHEARHGTPRYTRPGPLPRLALTACLAGGLAALVAAGLYAAAVDWSHQLVNLMLALSLALFLGAGVLAFAHDSIRLIPLNWTALIAAGVWLLTVPLPPGTYTRLTLNLQLLVSDLVLRTLHLLGVAAIRHGNIIELARTSVGVEEACSGIRSLLSCVFAGVFFSATLVRQPSARACIIALSAPIALAMNFLRSLTLTLLANNGVDISGTWHDVTGFAVLGVTAALLGGLALLFERGAKASEKRPSLPEAPARTTGGQWALLSALASASVLVGFFVANTRPSVERGKAAPDLFKLLPESAAGWHVRTSNLYQFSGTLQTDHLAQRTYVRATNGSPTEIVIYVAYWHAGQAPVSLVASHTPDACWPGSGWTALPTDYTRMRLASTGRQLPDAEYRLFRAIDRPQHVWFWHLYDGRPIEYRDPHSPVELLRLAWKYGFRQAGNQVFIRVSSNRPWSEIAQEELVAEFFGRARTMGL